MSCDTDILIVGAGPAGTASAILMAKNGWRVTLIERDAFPRQKVCGECVAAGNLELLDFLGIGGEFHRIAGPELRRVGWMSRTHSLSADMPACAEGKYAFGRAIGRDVLDTLLLERARSVGVTVLQPATVEAVHGTAGQFECQYSPSGVPREIGRRRYLTVTAGIVIAAHGSWDRGPRLSGEVFQPQASQRRRGDLFAFKTTFLNTRLEGGILPVFAIEGGYGGMVVANGGRTTVACCVRRDLLARCRTFAPGASAGTSVELYLRRACPFVDQLLDGAQQVGKWLSVGPVRPGVRMQKGDGTFRVGNAAGETHPLIGEGIGMAFQSSVLLTNEIRQFRPGGLNGADYGAIQKRYRAAWQRTFCHRMRLSRAYARIVMHPSLSRSVGVAFSKWPHLLTASARWAAKSQYAGGTAPPSEIS